MMRVAGLLPEGRIPMPNTQLQVEWFYMTFHKSNCADYMQSRHKLSNMMVQTVTEYFQLIHKTCENNGSLMLHQIKNIRAEAKRELCRKLEEQYVDKKRLLSNQRRCYRSYTQCNNGHHCCQHGGHKQRKLHNDGSCSNDKRGTRKSSSEHKDKKFKPYYIHGKHTKHSYEECDLTV